MKRDDGVRLQDLPKVDRLLENDQALTLVAGYSRGRVVEGIRSHLEGLRAAIRVEAVSAEELTPQAIMGAVEELLVRRQARRLRRVINATGIVLHTNLGRAPLARAALDAIEDVALGYSNLEFDLDSGKRGSRYSHVGELLSELTGAESALVVNNNAAAVTLVLNTFARDGEVIISRGELIEIGGSFRIPDVIERSGARIREVGATNITRIEDFSRAVTADTRVLMKVHPSNYRVVGFTKSVPREELVALGKGQGLMVFEDLGSGTLVDLSRYGLPREDTVPDVVKTGVDVVTFSGDKLLGGPQAGLIVGKKRVIDDLKVNPLIRALRIDKLSLAALEATLLLHRNEDKLREESPLLAMLTQDLATLQHKAERFAQDLFKRPGLSIEVGDGESFSGGGSLPDEGIPTKLVTLRPENTPAGRFLESLRRNDPPIIARITNECVVFDVRTMTDGDISQTIEAIAAILQ